MSYSYFVQFLYFIFLILFENFYFYSVYIIKKKGYNKILKQNTHTYQNLNISCTSANKIANKGKTLPDTEKNKNGKILQHPECHLEN